MHVNMTPNTTLVADEELENSQKLSANEHIAAIQYGLPGTYQTKYVSLNVYLYHYDTLCFCYFFVKLLLCLFSRLYNSLFLDEKDLAGRFSIKEQGGLLYRFYAIPVSVFARDYPLDRQITPPLDCTTSLSPTLWTTNCADKDSNPAEEAWIYEVEEVIESASAFVCIAHRSGQRLVFKILREFKDERYHYGSSEDRLRCQKEALRKNRTITPSIYQGLARISKSSIQQIEHMKRTGKLYSIKIGATVSESEWDEQSLDQDCEYALVMSYLPYEQRLDLLLRKERPEKRKEQLHLLAIRIEQLHRSFLPPDPATNEQGYSWGSYEQLFQKLLHNLAHLDLIERNEPTLYAQYYPLKADMQYFIKRLQDAFKLRLHSYVKQCHGDLKTRNTWLQAIEPGATPLHSVYILDAVDFNESYRNIDVLADLAMLVVDVEAIGGKELGAFLEKEYLALSDQTEEAAKLVLEYYLVEKAVVCAIMCLVYDQHERHMGPDFLAIASRHADQLRKMIQALD
jgi:aminoglycoside phosphotransferase family enzyme